jgi:hypothetical protein
VVKEMARKLMLSGVPDKHPRLEISKNFREFPGIIFPAKKSKYNLSNNS